MNVRRLLAQVGGDKKIFAKVCDVVAALHEEGKKPTAA